MDVDVEYFRSCSNMMEIQWWDVFDDRYHSYLVEGDKMLDEIVGEAANLLEEMPEGAKVFITSGDMNKLMEMSLGFEDYLVDDVVFLSPTDIMNGHLRGRIGTLLICDTWIMNDGFRHCLFQEQELMKCTMPRGD